MPNAKQTPPRDFSAVAEELRNLPPRVAPSGQEADDDSVGTHLREVSPEEMQKAMEQMAS